MSLFKTWWKPHSRTAPSLKVALFEKVETWALQCPCVSISSFITCAVHVNVYYVRVVNSFWQASHNSWGETSFPLLYVSSLQGSLLWQKGRLYHQTKLILSCSFPLGFQTNLISQRRSHMFSFCRITSEELHASHGICSRTVSTVQWHKLSCSWSGQFI